MIRRFASALALVASIVVASAASVGATTVPPAFDHVKATTAGDSLYLSFVERGLEPGQNYAYTGRGTLRETFQCYRTSTFTPLPKKRSVAGTASPDPRAYQANTNGVIRGFIYLESGIGWPDFCGGRQDVVPVRVCYAPYDLVDFVEPFDVFYFPDGTKICGAIEPD